MVDYYQLSSMNPKDITCLHHQALTATEKVSKKQNECVKLQA